MEKQKKLITRSQLRRVVGKVFFVGLYEDYVLAVRAYTALMRKDRHDLFMPGQRFESKRRLRPIGSAAF